jgi:hypothetical protein
MLLTETPRQTTEEIQSGANISPFFNGQPIRNLSSELFRRHLSLLCFGHLAVQEEAQTASDYGLTIATGPIGNNWNWTMHFRVKDSRSTLVSNVPTSDLGESGPIDKLHILWQHLTTDHQGRLWRQNFVSDGEHHLAGLIIRAFNSSRVFEGAEKLHREKAIAKGLYKDEEPKYFGSSRTPAHRHIGFAGGLGLKSTVNVAPAFIEPSISRKTITVESLPDFMVSAIKNIGSTFVSNASILNPEDPTRNKVLSLSALIESPAS